MIADPDFYRFNILCAGNSLKFLWDIPRNIQEIVLCKCIVKLWTLPDTSLELCSVCAKPFSNVFEHNTTTCPEISLFRNEWWETEIEDFDISLGAELAGLLQSELYSFLLGARRLIPSLPDYDSPELHLLNFRFIKDVTAVYYRTTCTSAFKERD